MPIIESSLFTWIKFILVFLPIWISGIYIYKKSTFENRWEILIPGGLIAGVSISIFIVSFGSLFFENKVLVISELISVILSLFFIVSLRRLKFNISTKVKLLSILFFVTWGVFIFDRVGRGDFGADWQMFYSIAKTFQNGNFPIKAPWQPDTLLHYHYGASLLLSQLNYFTNLSFDFLHRVITFVMLTASVWLMVWMLKKHTTIRSMLGYYLIPLVALVSVGSFMLMLPVIPIKFPDNLASDGLFEYIASMPTTTNGLAFDIWGGHTSIELIIYFIYQGVGFPIFLFVLLLLLKYQESWKYNFLLIIALTSLSVTNESYFIPALFASMFVALFNQFKSKGFKIINWKNIIIAAFLALFVVNVGGTVSTAILDQTNKDAIVFFPKESDFTDRWGWAKVDINKYHIEQIKSRALPQNERNLPFRFIHAGIFIVFISYLLTVAVGFRLKLKLNLNLQLFLITSSLVAIAVYFIIVPKYNWAATSRSLIIAYQCLGILVAFNVVKITECVFKKSKSLAIKIGLLFGLIWIFSASLLPPLFFLVYPSPHVNYLRKPIPALYFESTNWLKQNVTIKDRIFDAVYGAYFTNRWMERGDSRKYTLLAIQEGLMTPHFTSEYRTLHFEPSPEYLDVMYTLNPSALKKLKTNYLITDNLFENSLSIKRRGELGNPEYFERVYTNEKDPFKETIYKIKDKYFNEAEELSGSFDELNKVIEKKAKVFLEKVTPANEQLNWFPILKVVSLVLKDRDVYAKWDTPLLFTYSNFYMGVDTLIRVDTAKRSIGYDYLVLHKDTDPKTICDCNVKLVWQGIGDQVKVWERHHD